MLPSPKNLPTQGSLLPNSQACTLIHQSFQEIKQQKNVGVNIHSVEIVAETQYDSGGKITYTITCDSQDRKKNSVSSNKATNSVIPNGAYRSLKNILLVLILELAYGISPILHLGDVIYVKLSGDGQQVGKHHNHVMFTACILNKHDAVLSSSNQHCIFLYTGMEQYELLNQAFNFLIDELLTLNSEGIIDSTNNHWKIEF
ncbi:2919_t:CDS:2, partial [Cetraspora pellucida]